MTSPTNYSEAERHVLERWIAACDAWKTPSALIGIQSCIYGGLAAVADLDVSTALGFLRYVTKEIDPDGGVAARLLATLLPPQQSSQLLGLGAWPAKYFDLFPRSLMDRAASAAFALRMNRYPLKESVLRESTPSMFRRYEAIIRTGIVAPEKEGAFRRFLDGAAGRIPTASGELVEVHA